jgi:transcriptional regulator with XRE-family HTH domain
MTGNTPTEVEIAELFGGHARVIEPDNDELEIQIALRTIRDHLLSAAEHDKVGVNQLAGRLHISPSAVSRLLGGDSDMRVSTAVLYARALGRRWDFVLTDNETGTARGNIRGAPATVEIITTSTMTSGATVSISTGLMPVSRLSPPSPTPTWSKAFS